MADGLGALAVALSRHRTGTQACGIRWLNGAMDANALAARLDLDLDAIGICFACLSIVAMALDSGDEREVRRALDYVAPALWEEGLALPVRAALERADKTGDEEAEIAIAELASRGPRSPVLKAIVRRLGQDLSEQMRRDLDRDFPKARVMPLERG